MPHLFYHDSLLETKMHNLQLQQVSINVEKLRKLNEAVPVDSTLASKFVGEKIVGELDEVNLSESDELKRINANTI